MGCWQLDGYWFPLNTTQNDMPRWYHLDPLEPGKFYELFLHAHKARKSKGQNRLDELFFECVLPKSTCGGTR